VDCQLAPVQSVVRLLGVQHTLGRERRRCDVKQSGWVPGQVDWQLSQPLAGFALKQAVCIINGTKPKIEAKAFSFNRAFDNGEVIDTPRPISAGILSSATHLTIIYQKRQYLNQTPLRAFLRGFSRLHCPNPTRLGVILRINIESVMLKIHTLLIGVNHIIFGIN